jgi:excisionase family DNA binding protein
MSSRPEPIMAAQSEQPELARFVRMLDRLESDANGSRPTLVGAGGQEIRLPEALVRTLRSAARHLARGDSVTVTPVHRELTTQQAADILNVSRPYLVRLLETGEMPFRTTGSHRRVKLRDVLEYRQRRDVERRAALGELTRLSQELGLYDTPEQASG